jgi:excisionase family DNA binding protein
VTGRDRLLQSLAPELVDAIEQLVSDRVQAALELSNTLASSPWLSVEAAASYLGVSERTLERRIAGDRVRSTTIGRRRLLHRDDLDQARKSDGEGGRSANHATPPPPPKPRPLNVPGREE